MTPPHPPRRLDYILSHENLSVWPFSKEVLWSLSFPGRSFGFVIYCSVEQGNNWDHLSFWHPSVSIRITLFYGNWLITAHKLKQLSAMATLKYSALYLSLTKLGHPSFFQAFQFSSVLRMCCQNMSGETTENSSKDLADCKAASCNCSWNTAHLNHRCKLVSIRGDFSQQLQEHSMI